MGNIENKLDVTINSNPKKNASNQALKIYKQRGKKIKISQMIKDVALYLKKPN